jgi:elongation factor 3
MAASLPSVKSEIETVVAQIDSKKDGEKALAQLTEMVSTHGRIAEPFVISAFPKINEAFGDKTKTVREAAVVLAEAIVDMMSPYALNLIMPTLLAGIGTKAKPPQKAGTLKLISRMAQKMPESVGCALVNLAMPVAELTCDIKKDVSEAAVECMSAVCNCTGNKDLQPFLPSVVTAAKSIMDTHACVKALAGCIFVQNVQTPALACMLPVLSRGLKDKSEEVQRMCCMIVDNMCKVVEDPAEVLPVMPWLKPLVEGAVEKISDPEARGVAEKAFQTLQKAAGGGATAVQSMAQEDILKMLKASEKQEALSDDMCMHVSGLAAMAAKMKCFDAQAWKEIGIIEPYSSLMEDIRINLQEASKPVEEEEEEDEEGVDLYKGNFSLAYGTLTLLRDAKLRLKRNKFYGLLGPNQCGKTTLMRAIVNEQLEGFPKRDELKSIFVEHEIPEEEVGVQDDGFPILSVDKPGWWWVVHTCNDIYKLETPVTEDAVRDLMKETGFGYVGGPDCAAHMDNPVTTYSGGWKMKMQLCAAKLMNADVLMLDEPTGHLDVDNIKWLEEWLQAFPGSIICTSHFSPFLDKMCTHILDFQDRKLKTFKGEHGKCLSQFVEKYPEKKAYFELTNETMKFTFPEPGPLEGVKSRSKIVLRMSKVTFTYPSKDKPTIMDINLTCSQTSRVAVIGANGAGKTSAIKVFVGEMLPQEGTLWKAAGLRMGYVAQHAFHHLEKHMDKTPAQYIMWRFAGNDDKESLEFKSAELSIDEQAARAQKWCVDAVTGGVRKVTDPKEDAKKAKQDEANIVEVNGVVNRRALKKEKTFEYEVCLMYKPPECNVWIPKDTLIKMGYLKLVQREDEKQAAMAGLQTKQLTQPGVEKHLAAFGVDAESASHTQISQLSGGMKVKVVLAATMWQNPHILILDEPTNYLDRDGLGALVLAIKDYQGGVLIISHNKEFCDSVTTEKWIMNKGRLRIEGAAEEVVEEKKMDLGPKEDVYDGAGNKIDVKANVSLSQKDLKKKIKDIEKKLKSAKKDNTLSEDEMYELTDQLAELKENLKA